MNVPAHPPEPTGPPAYLLIRALENNVTITTIELSEGVRGSAVPERLQAGEIFVLFLDGRVQGYKIRGNAEVYSAYGTILGEQPAVHPGRGKIPAGS